MKKSFLALIPVLAVLPSLALAQNQTVTVNAAIANYSSTALAQGTLDLGSMTQGSASTAVAPSGATAAQVTVQFNVSSLSFSMPDNVTLTRTGGTETISAALSCATAATTNSGTTTACAAASGGAYTETVTYNGVHQTSLAARTLYIGGQVLATQSGKARAGAYTGTITVSITNITT